LQRDTAQRRAIRNAFEATDRPLTPQEVLDAARKEVPKLGIATVYRALKGFTDAGELDAVCVPGEPDRYERAGKRHHHHFRCRVCGKMFEMEGCPANLERLVPQGFGMEDHEVYIFGRCRRCA